MQQHRTTILQLLYEERGRGFAQGLDSEDLADRMGMAWDELRHEVAYLEEKRYLVVKDRQIGTRIFSTLRITAEGIDLVEGMVPERAVASDQVPPSQEDMEKTMAQIFLSYAREDKGKVESLYQKLSDAGFKPWMDTKDILPGERWELAIQEAIRCSDFFLVCLSENSVDKRGWIQREIREAMDNLKGMLDSDIYLIPVRLEDCGAPGSLRDLQWVNLFEANGWTQLVKAIQAGIERRL